MDSSILSREIEIKLSIRHARSRKRTRCVDGYYRLIKNHPTHFYHCHILKKLDPPALDNFFGNLLDCFS